MSIPTYDQLLRPVLELSTREAITRRSATTAMTKEFCLTEEEAKSRIPSGSATYIANRTGWAMSHLTKGGLIEKVEKYTYRATQKGRDYLAQHDGPITTEDLRNIEGLVEAWEEASKRNREKREHEADMGGSSVSITSKSTSTPEEQIDEAVASIDESLRAELLERLSQVDPYYFEEIVLDLLFAMGYGGNREEARKVTRKSNDEGIDGVINEDRLGLDVVYVQAKRWKNSVGRPNVQEFVGALAGKQASKGVFITTGHFSQDAIVYAGLVSQKVVLIDGARLADLMIEHNVGVSTVRTIALKRVDSDYFEES